MVIPLLESYNLTDSPCDVWGPAVLQHPESSGHCKHSYALASPVHSLYSHNYLKYNMIEYRQDGMDYGWHVNKQR